MKKIIVSNDPLRSKMEHICYKLGQPQQDNYHDAKSISDTMLNIYDIDIEKADYKATPEDLLVLKEILEQTLTDISWL